MRGLKRTKRKKTEETGLIAGFYRLHPRDLALAFYVFLILGGSVLAVSTVRTLFSEARRLEHLAVAGLQPDDHRTLIFNDIEPAAGD